MVQHLAAEAQRLHGDRCVSSPVVFAAHAAECIQDTALRRITQHFHHKLQSVDFEGRTASFVGMLSPTAGSES